MKFLNAPKHIPVFYNRADAEARRKIHLTCDHFGVGLEKRGLVGESILRLGTLMRENNMKFIPKDNRSAALIQMYQYFDSLT